MISMRYIVNDVDKAVNFYSDCLGFELEQQFGPAMAIMTKDGVTMWLAGPPSSAARPMPDGSKPEAGGWNRIVLQVENLREVVEKLKAREIRFRNEIVEGPGGLQILCEDPSGNPIELFEPAG